MPRSPSIHRHGLVFARRGRLARSLATLGLGSLVFTYAVPVAVAATSAADLRTPLPSVVVPTFAYPQFEKERAAEGDRPAASDRVERARPQAEERAAARTTAPSAASETPDAAGTPDEAAGVPSSPVAVAEPAPAGGEVAPPLDIVEDSLALAPVPASGGEE